MGQTGGEKSGTFFCIVLFVLMVTAFAVAFYAKEPDHKAHIEASDKKSQEHWNQLFEDGRRAGMSGIKASECPYPGYAFWGDSGRRRERWLAGHVAGLVERKEATKK